MKTERYGIVVCTKCGLARAVDLKNKTTGCSHCGKRLTLSKMRLYYKTNSMSELTWAVGRMNARSAGSEIPEEQERETDTYGKIAKEVKEGGTRRERLLIMATMLTREFGSFGTEELERIKDVTDLGEPGEMVDDLRKLREIYEPEEGRFVMVGF